MTAISTKKAIWTEKRMQWLNWCGVRIANVGNHTATANVTYNQLAFASGCTVGEKQMISVPTEKGERENDRGEKASN